MSAISDSAAEALTDALESDDAGVWWAGLKRSDEIEPEAFGRLLEARLASENRLIRLGEGGITEIIGVARGAAASFVAAGAAYETGIGIGSLVRAKYGPCEA